MSTEQVVIGHLGYLSVSTKYEYARSNTSPTNLCHALGHKWREARRMMVRRMEGKVGEREERSRRRGGGEEEEAGEEERRKRG